MKTLMVYHGAFGDIEVPPDIWVRSLRWGVYWPTYLADWAEFQYKRKRFG